MFLANDLLKRNAIAGAIENYHIISNPLRLRPYPPKTEYQQVVKALLDVETPFSSVTQGEPRANLDSIAALTTVGGGVPDFTANVNWSYFGAGSAVCRHQRR